VRSPPAQLRSSGLAAVLASLQGAGRRHVLDLGAPVAANVDFLAGYCCTLYVEDLLRVLRAQPAAGEEEGAQFAAAAFDGLVASRASAPFDAILGWDVANYLERDSMLRLARVLAEGSRPGTLLFLVVSTRDRVPGEAATFRIRDERHYDFEPSPAPPVTAPRYTPAALESMMPGFRLQHSFLSREGLQEYLFALE